MMVRHQWGFGIFPKKPETIRPDQERVSSGATLFDEGKLIKSPALWLRSAEAVGKVTRKNSITPIPVCLTLGLKARAVANSEWVAVEHHGARVRVGALGEKIFSP